MAKPDWITVNPSSGEGAGSFNIIFAENPSTSARSGVVTVKSISGLTHEIQVTQTGKVANFIQGSGKFCSIGVSVSILPDRLSQITFCAQIVLSNGTKVGAGYLTLTTNGNSVIFGDLTLDSEKLPVNGQANITSIFVTCVPGNEPWTHPFAYCVGRLEYNPGNIAFGVVGSSQTYSATFEQFSVNTWGFSFSTPIPISGDTTLVYKGNTDNTPAIFIERLIYN